MELGKDFRKVFYIGGVITLVLSVLLIWRTLFSVVPMVGFASAAPFLVISVLFFVVGVALLVAARRDAKKEAVRQATPQEGDAP